MPSLENNLALSAIVLVAAIPQAAVLPAARETLLAISADAAQTLNVLPDAGAAPLTVIAVENGTVGVPFVTPLGATARLSADGVFSYDPAGAFVSLPAGEEISESIGYCLSDGVAQTSGMILVIIAGVNTRPSLTGASTDLSFVAGAAIAPTDLTILFSDPGDSLTFSAAGLPAGLTLDSRTGLLTGALETAATAIAVTIRATDLADQSASADIAITIAAPSVAPTLLASVPDQSWVAGENISPIDLTTRFSGAASYALAPGSAALPAGVSITGRQIDGVPQAASAAVTVTIRATAASGAFTDDSFAFTVDHATVAYVLPYPLVWDAPMQPISLADSGLWAIKPNSFMLVGAAVPGFVVDPLNGTLTGTPAGTTGADGGAIRVRASDGSVGQVLEIAVSVEAVAPSLLLSSVPLIWNNGPGKVIPRWDGTVDIIANGTGNFNPYWAQAPGVPVGTALDVAIEFEPINGLVLDGTGPAPGSVIFQAMTVAPNSSTGRYLNVSIFGPTPVLTFSTQITTTATTGFITPAMVGISAGQGIRVRSVTFSAPAQAPLLLTGKIGDTTLPVGGRVFIDASRGFIGADAYALAPGSAALPAGLAINAATGIIDGDGPVAPTSAALIVRGTKTASGGFLDQPLTLAFTEGDYTYVSEIDGPLGYNFSDFSVTKFPALASMAGLSVVEVQPDRSFRVIRKSGPGARAMQRLTGLTKGAQYTITPAAFGAGNVGATAPARIRVGKSSMGPDFGSGDNEVVAPDWVADVSWTLDQPAPVVTFTAPSDDPFVLIETATPDTATIATTDEFFVIPATGAVSVAPVDAVNDAVVPGGGVRIGPEVAVTGGVARRLFNLEMGRKYTLSASGTGATSLRISHDSSGDQKAFAPRTLGNLTDTLAASVTGAEFIARDTIMWLVAKGASALAVTSLAPVARQWPPAVLTADAGVPFPFLSDWPAVPAATVTVSGGGAELMAALNAATGGEVIVVQPGSYTSGTLVAKRYTSPVLVVAAEQYGATVADGFALSDVRNLTLRGLRFAGKATLRDTSDITFDHNLFAYQAAGAAGPIVTVSGSLNFYLTITNNDLTSIIADPLDQASNNLGPITLSNVFNVKIAGNRVIHGRDDPIKASGQYIQIEHNYLGDGAYGDQAHADLVQLAAPGDGLENFGNDHITIRRNFGHDTVIGFEASNTNRMDGVANAQQIYGQDDFTMDDNIIDSPAESFATWTSGPIRNMRITHNIDARESIMFESSVWDHAQAIVSGNAVNNIGFRTPAFAGLVGALDGRRISIGNNLIDRTVSGKWLDTVANFTDPSNIFGWTVKAGSPDGSVSGNAATALAGATLGPYLAAKAAPPRAPLPWQWVAAGGSGLILVTITAAPRGSDTILTGFEYRLDGGAWTALAGITLPLTRSVTIAASAGAHSVELRAASVLGAGAASAAKTVVVG